ncbi:TonB-dependent receptor [Acinetobacter wanghuae]|uniref:TonB-dependent receptor n=1 Tax=Acinetobacter wanghuae TaxID=2662362 RepID=A0A5Q0P835_9GAMM|nr:TonB-dependent receptor [Acinetobacter wanghuae]MQW92816.1 TonB-dependent receptor [Acinetobacter wanghuae]QGA11808.1 TonB-dependent receptor [Acinetobacter wanghuae]
MSIQFQPTALVGAIALALGFTSSVHAAEQKIAKASLDTIVVTAARSEQNIKDVPARISIIEPKIIEQSPIAQFSDLLRSEAAINVVQLGGYGQQTSIFMRGTDSDHTLVLRDGVRLNNEASGATSLNFLDTTDIKQIEVLKGPASVLYGTNAIGGVVQIISKTPQKSAAFITAEVGEHNTYKSLIGADFAENDLFAQVRGQRLESNGTKISDHQDAIASNYDQKGFSAKVGLEKAHYGFSLDYSENEGTSVYQGFDWASDSYVNKAHTFENNITTLKAYAQLNPSLRADARISQFKDRLEQLKSFEITEYTANEYELMFKQQLGSKQNVNVGVTHKDLETETNKPLSSFAQQLDTTGYYIQHQYQCDRLNTQIGYRLEDHDKYGSHEVGQAGVRYHFNPTFSVYSNIGTAFKAPTVNDLYYGSSSNPHLKPEESISYEIGFDQQLNNTWSFGASIYRTDINNLIDYAAVSPWNLDNISKARMQGAEAFMHWAQDDYFFKTSYHYVKATNEKTDTELLRRPRQTLSISAGLENAQYGLSATVIAKSKAKDWDTTQSTPGYATVDLHSYWNVNPNIKLFSNIQNVGDVNYKAAYDGSVDGVYYINGGRLASLGVTVKY